MKAYELIQNPENWTKGGFARNKLNVFVNERSPEACSFCAAGAIYKIYGSGRELNLMENYHELLFHVRVAGYLGITNWNDSYTQDHKKVYDTLRKFDL